MLPPRLITVLLGACLAVCACTSSGASPGTTSDTSASGAAVPSSSSSAAASGSPAAAALAATVRKGLTGLRSAHLQVRAGDLLPSTSGDVRYADGRATASRLTIGAGAQRTTIVTVGSATWAKLPTGRNTSARPWVRVTRSSTNEFVRALASELDLTAAVSSLSTVADLVATAPTVRGPGTTPRGRHYSLVVEPSASAGSLGALLGAIGQQHVPVDLYLDRHGRPVETVVRVRIGDQPTPVTVTASRFDAPVHIGAPARNQVGS